MIRNLRFGLPVLLVVLSLHLNAQSPSIYSLLPNIAICEGSWSADTVLANFATGYRWQLSDINGQLWTDVAGNPLFNGTNTNALRIYGDPSLQSHLIRCIVSNANGAAVSSNAFIQVDSGVPTGLNFSCPTTTLCAGASELVWVDGVALADSIFWNYTGNAASYNTVNIADTLNQVHFYNAGAYSVSATVRNGCGQTVTNAVPVTVNAATNTLAGTAGGAAECTDLSVTNNVGVSYGDNSCNPIGGVLVSGPPIPIFASMQVCSQEDASAQSFNGIPYVPRHYSLVPNFTLPAGGMVEVNLYFTQADFNAYNAVRGSEPALPTGPFDNTGISNLRVTQFHGTGTTPDTYVGGSGVIDPPDPWIVWDATNSRWSVTFDITGFSGFFVSGASLVPLPLTLTNFSGQALTAGNLLSWQTSSEQNTAYFEIQRTAPGSSGFEDLGRIAAAGNSQQTRTYGYTDIFSGPAHPAYSYRLRMVDLDGKHSYSPVVTLQPTVPSLTVTVSPNPFVQPVSVTVGSPTAGAAVVAVLNMSGARVIERSVVLQRGDNALDVSMITGLPQGIYFLQVNTNTQQQTVKFVKE